LAAGSKNLKPQRAQRSREGREGRRGAGGRAWGGRSSVVVRRRGSGKSAVVGFRTTKEQGEWAELCFMARARQIGMTVLKPWGDSLQYDVGIEREGRLLRVQVKSSTYVRGGTYTCNLVGPGHAMYAEGQVDYFAVYLVQVDRWYIVPWEAVCEGRGSVQFTPGRAGHKHEKYLEAWNLLR
jgi:hypothetical protein